MNPIIENKYWFNRINGGFGTEVTVWVPAENLDKRARRKVDGVPYMWQSTGACWIDVEATHAHYGLPLEGSYIVPPESVWWEGPSSLIPSPGWVEITKELYDRLDSLFMSGDYPPVDKAIKFLADLGFDAMSAPELKAKV